jgi:pyruvate ferredoxin oxidoreductase delta subunit
MAPAQLVPPAVGPPAGGSATGPRSPADLRDIHRVEINYRGIFQKTLGYRLAHDIVYAAHAEGRTAFSNGRYSDDPQRNGIPCANFVFVSGSLSEEALEAVASAKMDVDEAELVVVLDDTLVKGVEPWGHYGIRPINQKVVAGSTLLILSLRKADELLPHLERKPFSYRIAILPGERSFSGLWQFRDDGSDARLLGAVARAAPQLLSREAAEARVRRAYGEGRVALVRDGWEMVEFRDVAPGEGQTWPYPRPELPAWSDFAEGIAVPGVTRGFQRGPRGQNRNPDFKRGTSRTERPVIRFDTCTQCTLCWYECPDGCFDPTVAGTFDVDYEYCTGCGRCAQVCPVDDCIVMVDEGRFLTAGDGSPWVEYLSDPAGYVARVEAVKGPTRVIPAFVTGAGPDVVPAGPAVPYKPRRAP